MRIVYMGTPDIAVPTLRFLAESKHEVVGVLTQPDRPKGRGHHTIPTPVKAAALEYDIPVYQPLSLRKGEDAAAALETLRQAGTGSDRGAGIRTAFAERSAGTAEVSLHQPPRFSAAGIPRSSPDPSG